MMLNILNTLEENVGDDVELDLYNPEMTLKREILLETRGFIYSSVPTER